MEKYNLPHEEIKRFEIYNDRNTEQMPKLIADGRVPLNVAQLMQRRLNLRNDDSGVKSFYMNNWFDTGDAVVYHPDGRVKIVLDSQTLREINSKSKLNYGALILTEDVYNSLQGEEFKKGKLGKVNEWLSKEAAKNHPIWKVLARDPKLLKDYVNFIFAEGKYDEAMGIFPSSAQGSTPELRAWYVDGLEDGSDASGRSDLDDYVGRFLGIAPEALSALGKGVSNIQAYTMTDLQAFDSAVKGLEATVRSELLEPLAQLRKKL